MEAAGALGSLTQTAASEPASERQGFGRRVETVRNDVTIDWILRESTRAQLRVLVLEASLAGVGLSPRMNPMARTQQEEASHP